MVEESELPGEEGQQCVRRLVFINSSHLAQTEVMMIPSESLYMYM